MSRTLIFTAALALALHFTSLAPLAAQHPSDRSITSRLEIYDLETGARTVLREFPFVVEAPNWTSDGRFLIYNTSGQIHRIEIADPSNDTLIPSFPASSCNNDHVLSPDGTRLAVSSGTADDWRSRIYILPLSGSSDECPARLVTPLAPSYLHGWSPDGTTLAYCAERNGNYDVYTISTDPAASPVETRLTSADGLDDGSEYSPDGAYIWFNSARSGTMQIWRMLADGSRQTQITLDETRNSWFPHVSPDGRSVLYIAYLASEVSPGDHPAGKDVELRIISARQSGPEETLLTLFGGQGSLNVNSWAPDSRRFAFVSYEYGE